MKIKDVTLIGVFTALLLGGQLALSGISGIEIVTVLFASFVYARGTKNGLMLATCFTLIRCFIFGFIPTVIILYLIYYNLFAVVVGGLSFVFKRKLSAKIMVILIITVLILTVIFTMLDNVITPLFYGYSRETAKAYFIASLYAVIPQTICSVVTMSCLFYPLIKLYERLNVIKE